MERAEATLYKARKTVDELEDLQDEQESSASAPSTATTGPSADEVTDADITAAKKDVTAAKAGLAAAEAQCSSARLAYEQAKAAKSELTVNAPVSGTVWAVNVEEGDSVSTSSGGSSGNAAPGAATTASSSSAPVSIATGDELAVRLAVNEVDVPTLEVGQRADLAFDALPDLSLTGQVAEMIRRAQWTRASSPTTSGSRSTSKTRSSRRGMSRLGQRSSPTVARGVLLELRTPPVKSATTSGEYVQVIDRWRHPAASGRDGRPPGLEGPHARPSSTAGSKEGAGRRHQGHRSNGQPADATAAEDSAGRSVAGVTARPADGRRTADARSSRRSIVHKAYDGGRRQDPRPARRDAHRRAGRVRRHHGAQSGSGKTTLMNIVGSAGHTELWHVPHSGPRRE